MLGDLFPRAGELCHSSRITQSLLSCLLGWVLIFLKHQSYRQLCLTSRTRSQVCPFNGILQHCGCGTAQYCTSVDADELVPLWCIVVAIFHQNCFKMLSLRMFYFQVVTKNIMMMMINNKLCQVPQQLHNHAALWGLFLFNIIFNAVNWLSLSFCSDDCRAWKSCCCYWCRTYSYWTFHIYSWVLI